MKASETRVMKVFHRLKMHGLGWIVQARGMQQIKKQRDERSSRQRSGGGGTRVSNRQTINPGRRSPKESLVEKKNTDRCGLEGLTVSSRERMLGEPEAGRIEQRRREEIEKKYGDSG